MSDKYPMICEAGIEFKILVKDIEHNGIVEHIIHEVNIFSDGSVFAKEIYTQIMSKEKILRSELFHNFKEFAEAFPEDSKIVLGFLIENNVNIPWIK